MDNFKYTVRQKPHKQSGDQLNFCQSTDMSLVDLCVDGSRGIHRSDKFEW